MGKVCPSAGSLNSKDGPAKIPIEPRNGPDPLSPPSGGKTPVVSRKFGQGERRLKSGDGRLAHRKSFGSSQAGDDVRNKVTSDEI
jgi:hypothetical protein